ncbi:hypothetical protein HMPREF9455_00273 [Dysgonomonas gadei ATCC BAA-286]|uniref:YWFCY domain-containing protein n=1 Tax=Dysgonomonas gadei ATCC BAA-286 TaxID=742766 RepID=F5IT56_9BACT|nr:hypothetical protein HMPREF9455_00273 [Dysgonomonas gadei ATCC BAA-286]
MASILDYRMVCNNLSILHLVLTKLFLFMLQMLFIFVSSIPWIFINNIESPFTSFQRGIMTVKTRF